MGKCSSTAQRRGRRKSTDSEPILAPERDLPEHSTFLSLPRELRDMIYFHAAEPRINKLPIEKDITTPVLFENLPSPSLLQVSQQIRAEVLDAITRSTRILAVGTYDCKPLNESKAPARDLRLAASRIRKATIALDNWIPIENDVGPYLDFANNTQLLNLMKI
jgi:hypothetical protein